MAAAFCPHTNSCSWTLFARSQLLLLHYSLTSVVKQGPKPVTWTTCDYASVFHPRNKLKCHITLAQQEHGFTSAHETDSRLNLALEFSWSTFFQEAHQKKDTENTLAKVCGVATLHASKDVVFPTLPLLALSGTPHLPLKKPQRTGQS